jgi:hypothetical protein
MINETIIDRFSGAMTMVAMAEAGGGARCRCLVNLKAASVPSVSDLEINSNLQVIRAEIPSAGEIMKRHCELMLLTTMVLFGCAPALGQTPALAGPTSSTQDGASVPDFSGTWVRPYFGANEALNEARRRANT